MRSRGKGTSGEGTFRPANILVPGLFAAALLAAAAFQQLLAVGVGPRSTFGDALVSDEAVEQFISQAVADQKPAILVFESPGCVWTAQFVAEVLPDHEVKAALDRLKFKRFVVDANPAAAQRYKIRRSPTFIRINAAGKETARHEGSIDRTGFLAFIANPLNQIPTETPPAFEREAMHTVVEVPRLVARVRDGIPADLSHQEWRELVTLVSDPVHGKAVRTAIDSADPLPRELLVDLLDDDRLATRLAALEVLETRAGDDFGMDPWAERSARSESLAKWIAWAKDGAAGNGAPTALDDETIVGYLNDLVSDDDLVSATAFEQLNRAGPAVISLLNLFVERNPDLSPAETSKLRHLRYSLILVEDGEKDAANLARDATRGNLDERIAALGTIAGRGARGQSIVADYLTDPEPLVREAAIDALIVHGGRNAVPVLAKAVETESDPNVLHAVVRGLGKVGSPEAADVLNAFSDHPNEDLAVTALISLGSFSELSRLESIQAALSDKRWRVRAAAIDALAELRGTIDLALIRSLLTDEDEFVRITAIRAVATLETQGVNDLLVREFKSDPALRPTIMEAFASFESPIPEEVSAMVTSMPPDEILGLLGAISSVDEASVDLLSQLANHPNEDVRSAAVRMIADGDSDDPKIVAFVEKVLRTGTAAEHTAVLEEYKPSNHSVGYALRTVVQDESTFFESVEPEPVVAAKTRERSGIIGRLLGARKTVEPRELERRNLGLSLLRLRTTVRNLAVETPDPQVRIAAAILMLELGSDAGATLLLEQLQRLPDGKRQRTAAALSNSKTPATFPLFMALLQDPNARVREEALSSVDSATRGDQLERIAAVVLEQVDSTNTNLTIADLFESRFSYHLLRNSQKPAVAIDWARRQLEDANADADKQVLAIAMLRDPELFQTNSETLKAFLDSENPWVRREALYTYLTNLSPPSSDLIQRAVEDPMEYVREALPASLMDDWCIHLDESSDYVFYNSRRHDETELDDNVRKALVALTKDSSRRVRLAAYSALMAHNQPLDAEAVVELLQEVEAEALAAGHGTYVSDRGFRQIEKLLSNEVMGMPQAYAPIAEAMLKHVYEGAQERIEQHFKLTSTEVGPGEAVEQANAALSSNSEPQSVEETPATQREESNIASATNRIELVYFSKPGCSHCEEVQGMLARIRETIPNFDVVEYNINKQASMRLNESLAERFGVPENLRLVAPALFATGGFLVRDEISDERVARLLMASSETEAAPLVVPDEQLATADAAISQRYQSINAGLIIGAGLLDGLNPCAFATIIFLISYLQVARRTPTEIAAIGFAYCAGVFTSYFVLGLGLVEIVSRITVLKWASTALNVTMGVAVIFLAILSIRDGWLCMKGRMADMTLQLPDVLKGRIHGMIRSTARQRQFVLLAFGVGAVISLLELACTGQVYAPTILYMLQSGNSAALGWLALYNLSFVLPLVAVMALVVFGMRSETLVDFLRRRAAIVKFGMAGIFLLLGALLLSREIG